MLISGAFVLLKHDLNLREDAQEQTAKTDQRANLFLRKWKNDSFGKEVKV